MQIYIKQKNPNKLPWVYYEPLQGQQDGRMTSALEVSEI